MKFTLVSWDRARGRASLCMYSLESQIQADYRNRPAKFKYLSQTMAYFWRLRVQSVKVKLELN